MSHVSDLRHLYPFLTAFNRRRAQLLKALVHGLDACLWDDFDKRLSTCAHASKNGSFVYLVLLCLLLDESPERRFGRKKNCPSVLQLLQMAVWDKRPIFLTDRKVVRGN